MKFIIGPGVNELKVLDSKGNDITSELSITDIRFEVGVGELPKAEIRMDVWGDIHQIDVKEENIIAYLNKLGVSKIESSSESFKEATVADFHPNA